MAYTCMAVFGFSRSPTVTLYTNCRHFNLSICPALLRGYLLTYKYFAALYTLQRTHTMMVHSEGDGGGDDSGIRYRCWWSFAPFCPHCSHFILPSSSLSASSSYFLYTFNDSRKYKQATEVVNIVLLTLFCKKSNFMNFIYIVFV